jgi:2-C-methyl-D-erythritol 4-phosphate cytidylyltransferase
MSLGEKIRKRRLELKLSQQDLADALGYKTRSSIAKLEKNKSRLTHEKIVMLARTLQTTVNYLVTSANEEESGRHGTLITSDDLQNEDSRQKDKQKHIAVILAGGKKRINKYNIPYQFVSVKGKPVVLYTIETMQHHPQIDEIHVVCLEGWEEFFPAYAKRYNITKLKSIIPAGNSGIESVKNAVERLLPVHKATDLVIIQEATRPFVAPEIVSNAIRCCKQYGNAVTYEEMDALTPFLVNKNQQGLTHLPAKRVINIQSPEVYTLGALRLAFFEAAKINHPLDETYCAVFLHHLGKELKFCKGSHSNIRIVYEEDLKLLEILIKGSAD